MTRTGSRAVGGSSLRWSPLASVERGLTNMAPAFEMVASALAPGQLERRALRPALLLVTDGLPTDPPERFDSALETLLSARAGKAALRLRLRSAATPGPKL